MIINQRVSSRFFDITRVHLMRVLQKNIAPFLTWFVKKLSLVLVVSSKFLTSFQGGVAVSLTAFELSDFAWTQSLLESEGKRYLSQSLLCTA